MGNVAKEENNSLILNNQMKLDVRACLKEAKEILDRIDMCEYINYLHKKHLNLDRVEVKQAIEVDLKRWNNTKTFEFKRLQQLCEILNWIVNKPNYTGLEGCISEILNDNTFEISNLD